MGGKITLSMIVHNERGRYLEQLLKEHRSYIHEAVILDDGSTDDTAALCLELLRDIPVCLIRTPVSSFHNEVELRKRQWRETVARNPEWILVLDADEGFEANPGSMLEEITTQQDYNTIYLRLYDMWNDSHYRDDRFWNAHQMYRPFLVRYIPGQSWSWKETPQHCGRLPLEVLQYSYWCHPLRVKHYGWSRLEDRRMKLARYRQLDPNMQYGWKEQYDSILDENPNLVPWED